MLNLSIVMKRFLLTLTVLLILPVRRAHAQNENALVILSPEIGKIVQGTVDIIGTVTILGFSSYELAFTYEGDTTNTWFNISSSTTPVFEGELGTWDTTTITDGDYILRLQVSLLDGSVQQTTISGLRVRNYTAVPTATPEPTPTSISPLIAPTAQLIVSVAEATATLSLPTPTRLPSNPAGLGIPSITTALGRGALLVLLLFLSFGLLLRLRRDS